MDATSNQLITETRLPLPAPAGQPQRLADEYARHGTRTLLLCVEPQAGRRPVQVTAQRTKGDLARAMQWLVDIGSPEAEVMRGVLDHLNTQKLASLSEAFEPAEARRIARKLALHDTPKHGRWFNMAAIALACPPAPRPRSPDPRRGHAQARNRSLGTPAQRRAGHHRLALFSH